MFAGSQDTILKKTLGLLDGILLSVINECALAMENAKDALEKNAVMAEAAERRCGRIFAGRFRAVLRTPHASISVMQICARQ